MHNYCGYQYAKKRALGSTLPRLPIMGILEVFSDIPVIGILGVRIGWHKYLNFAPKIQAWTKYYKWTGDLCKNF